MTLTLTLPVGESVYTGRQVTFEAPCKSEGLTGLVINKVTYDIVDAEGHTPVANAFEKGALVSVIFHVEKKKAFIQNANTNAYLENKLSAIGSSKINHYSELADIGLSDADMSADTTEEALLANLRVIYNGMGNKSTQGELWVSLSSSVNSNLWSGILAKFQKDLSVTSSHSFNARFIRQPYTLEILISSTSTTSGAYANEFSCVFRSNTYLSKFAKVRDRNGFVSADGSSKMTGKLDIVMAEYPGVAMDETTKGSRGIIQNYGHALVLDQFNVAGDAQNRRSLVLSDSDSQPDIKDALRLRDTVAGSTKYHHVIHTGNLDKIAPEAIGAAKASTHSIPHYRLADLGLTADSFYPDLDKMRDNLYAIYSFADFTESQPNGEIWAILSKSTGYFPNLWSCLTAKLQEDLGVTTTLTLLVQFIRRPYVLEVRVVPQSTSFYGYEYGFVYRRHSSGDYLSKASVIKDPNGFVSRKASNLLEPGSDITFQDSKASGLRLKSISDGSNITALGDVNDADSDRAVLKMAPPSLLSEGKEANALRFGINKGRDSDGSPTSTTWYNVLHTGNMDLITPEKIGAAKASQHTSPIYNTLEAIGLTADSFVDESGNLITANECLSKIHNGLAVGSQLYLYNIGTGNNVANIIYGKLLSDIGLSTTSTLNVFFHRMAYQTKVVVSLVSTTSNRYKYEFSCIYKGTNFVSAFIATMHPAGFIPVDGSANMSGDLRIVKDNVSRVKLLTKKGQEVRFTSDDDIGGATVHAMASSESNTYRQLRVLHDGKAASVANALVLSDTTATGTSYYKLYGEHNAHSHSPSEVGALPKVTLGLNDDLDVLLKSGVHQGIYSVDASVKNAPRYTVIEDGVEFVSIPYSDVLSSAVSNSSGFQIAYPHGEGYPVFRQLRSDGTISEWATMYNSLKKPTPLEIGAAPATNILDNGDFSNVVDQKQGYIVLPGVKYYSDPSLSEDSYVGTIEKYSVVSDIYETYCSITVSSTKRYVSPNDIVRGYVGYSQVTFDRWFSASALRAHIKENSVELTCVSTSSANGLTQRIPPEKTPKAGTKVTFAMCDVNDNLYVGSVEMPEEGTRNNPISNTDDPFYIRLYAPNYEGTDGLARVSIMVRVGKSIDLKWVALYEGEYTKETLPPYQPKGYAAEYAICRQYDPSTDSHIGFDFLETAILPELYGEHNKPKVADIDGLDDYIESEVEGYVGNPLKIMVGSYTGDGTCGVEHPNTLTFPSRVRTISFVLGTNNGGISTIGWAIDSLTTEYQGLGNLESIKMKVNAARTSVQWYYSAFSSDAPSRQYNEEGKKYYYFAILQ